MLIMMQNLLHLQKTIKNLLNNLNYLLSQSKPAPEEINVLISELKKFKNLYQQTADNIDYEEIQDKEAERIIAQLKEGKTIEEILG